MRTSKWEIIWQKRIEKVGKEWELIMDRDWKTEWISNFCDYRFWICVQFVHWMSTHWLLQSRRPADVSQSRKDGLISELVLKSLHNWMNVSIFEIICCVFLSLTNFPTKKKKQTLLIIWMHQLRESQELMFQCHTQSQLKILRWFKFHTLLMQQNVLVTENKSKKINQMVKD